MFSIEVRHNGLNKYRMITGRDKYVVEEKARVQLAAWNAVWERQTSRQAMLQSQEQKKEDAATLTAEAKEAISEREHLLINSLSKTPTVDWDRKKSRGPFPTPCPPQPCVGAHEREPQPADPEFIPKFGFLDRIFTSRRQRIRMEAAKLYEIRHDEWRVECAQSDRRTAAAEARYVAERASWERERDAYYAAQNKANNAVDDLRRRYQACEAQAIVDYYDMVLSTSEYPDCFPDEWTVDFASETGVLVVDYRLPCLADMPTLKEVKYVTSRDAFEEAFLKDSVVNSLYDSVVYQICLRTIREIYVTDVTSVVKAVVFNGWVNYVNPANGVETSACIVSLRASCEEFGKLNLASVDPKACFRSLKGVGSTQLHAMAPVQPLIQISRDDPRFVSSADVASGLNKGTNLAAIGWEEFEHLIREIFEREFSANGGEVKVTQTSRDGGVDAIAFDPDPIRGGKIVIQAKRYTNTVDVSAVRDLYGTVMNEGATKGILVTTSNFGPDAYNFAKDKPLTLMDGNNLLYLLSKHGHQARIDLKEAKKLGLSMQR